MKQFKPLKLFKKTKLSEDEIKIRKFPKKKRAKLRRLLKDYNDGYILIVEKDNNGNNSK